MPTPFRMPYAVLQHLSHITPYHLMSPHITPQAFGFQLSNGIPIESWYDNDDDRELVHLMEFLKHLAAADDVRPVICQTFKLQELVEAA